MYAAVPRITPILVIAGEVIVGNAAAFVLPPDTGSSAFARPKSNTLTMPSGRTLTFAGFQIAMDDTLFVSRFKPFRDLTGDRQRLVYGNRSLSYPIRKRRPL